LRVANDRCGALAAHQRNRFRDIRLQHDGGSIPLLVEDAFAGL
jgi:hypothetical protein